MPGDKEEEAMWGFLIALLSGALMSIQGVFNTGVTKEAGTWIAAGFVQVTAFLTCVIAWFISGREGTVGSLFHIESKYMLLGGVIGAFITFTVIQAIEKIGPAGATMLIVAAQLTTAYLIELFGLFGTEKAEFSWRKLLGVGVMAAGIFLFQGMEWKK